MSASYRKLLKIVTDQYLNNKDFRLTAGISKNTFIKLGKNAEVSMKTIMKTCMA